MATTSTSVRFSPEVLAFIKEQAKLEQCSVSNFLNKLVSSFMKSDVPATDRDFDEQTWRDIEQAREEHRNGTTFKCDTWEDSKCFLENL